MSEYLTLQNIKKCLDVFESRLNVSLDELGSRTKTNPRRILFQIMKNIANDPPNDESILTLKGLNNYTLQKFYNYYFHESTNEVVEDADLVEKVLNELHEEPKTVPVSTNSSYSYVEPFEHDRSELLIKPPSKRKEDVRYITINGYDRNWVNNPSRYRFTIDTTELMTNYKNICEIELTKLIIVPKKHSVLPYLVVRIPELNGKNDGLNDANKGSMSTFIVDKLVDGVVFMRSIQDKESAVFDPPLSSLPKLTIEILKHNNVLYSEETDSNKLWKIEYDKNNNNKLLKVWLTKYVHKDQFDTGHIIFIRNIKYPYYSSSYDDSYKHYDKNRTMFNSLMSYMNRPEGHEIQKLGQTTKDCHLQSFFINAPGDYNQNTGKYELKSEMIDLIQETEDKNFDYTLSPTPIGSVLNSSLQPVISMKVKQTLLTSENPIYSVL